LVMVRQDHGAAMALQIEDFFGYRLYGGHFVLVLIPVYRNGVIKSRYATFCLCTHAGFSIRSGRAGGASRRRD